MRKVKLGSLFVNDKVVDPYYPVVFKKECTIDIKDTQEGKEIQWFELNGILVADRCLLSSISYDDIAEFKNTISIDGKEYCLSVPTKKEIDDIVVCLGDYIDDFHWNGFYSWTSDSYWSNSSKKYIYGYSGARNWNYNTSGDYINGDLGWRPALRPLNTDSKNDDIKNILEKIKLNTEDILQQISQITKE